MEDGKPKLSLNLNLIKITAISPAGSAILDEVTEIMEMEVAETVEMEVAETGDRGSRDCGDGGSRDY